MAKSLFDNLKKVYRINVKCTNCGEFLELSIPKGVTIESYLKSDISRCNNCGVSSLVKYNYPETKPQQPVSTTKIVWGKENDKKK